MKNFVIAGLQKSSLLDYPEKISAIIFTQGCNFRCSYCHNPELLNFADGKICPQECLAFLKTRQKKLDGVVITGGEPCLQKGLITFIKEIKKLNFAIKLDTNGTCPEVIKQLLDLKLLDYIAMDIKAPLEKYKEIVGFEIEPDKIKKTIDLIMRSGVDYEFRTTVLKSQLSFQDFQDIGKLINGAKKYYLQKFVPSKIYNEQLMREKSYTEEEFFPIKQELKKNIQFVDIR